jgi:hypothetical protein
MVVAHFREHSRKSVVFQFLPIERTSIQGAKTTPRAWAAWHSSLFDRYQPT